jgi:hypothetical protein
MKATAKLVAMCRFTGDLSNEIDIPKLSPDIDTTEGGEVGTS